MSHRIANVKFSRLAIQQRESNGQCLTPTVPPSSGSPLVVAAACGYALLIGVYPGSCRAILATPKDFGRLPVMVDVHVHAGRRQGEKAHTNRTQREKASCTGQFEKKRPPLVSRTVAMEARLSLALLRDRSCRTCSALTLSPEAHGTQISDSAPQKVRGLQVSCDPTNGYQTTESIYGYHICFAVGTELTRHRFAYSSPGLNKRWKSLT
jgi:hypothetical protein